MNETIPSVRDYSRNKLNWADYERIRDAEDALIGLGDKLQRGEPLRVEGIRGIIGIGKEFVRNPHESELYLTECVGCCSRSEQGASYRLFSSVPQLWTPEDSYAQFQRGDRGLHPDTTRNPWNIMVAKCYAEPRGLSERIAKIISTNSQRLLEGVPKQSIIWKLK
jgi:hypothetical protein